MAGEKDSQVPFVGKSMVGMDLAAEAQELVEREGEPPMCWCGKHYIGAECPEQRR